MSYTIGNITAWEQDDAKGIVQISTHDHDGEDLIVLLLSTRTAEDPFGELTATWSGVNVPVQKEESYLSTWHTHAWIGYLPSASTGVKTLQVTDSSDQNPDVGAGPYGRYYIISVSGLTGTVEATDGGTSVSDLVSSALTVTNGALIIKGVSMQWYISAATPYSPLSSVSSGSVGPVDQERANSSIVAKATGVYGDQTYTVDTSSVRKAYVAASFPVTSAGAAANPDISPSAGDITTSTLITVTGSPGTSLKITTDGSDPSGEAEVSSPQTMYLDKGAAQTVKAIATAGDFTDSGIESVEYDVFLLGNQASISVIAPESVTLRISCASTTAYIDASSNVWEADRGYIGGNTWTHEVPVSGTEEDELYYTMRHWWDIDPLVRARGVYEFPNVADGTYDLTLGYMEGNPAAVGERVFDVTVNGSLVENDLDIFNEVGEDAALWKKYSVTVASGEGLTIEFDASADTPTVSYILLESDTPPTFLVEPTAESGVNGYTATFTSSVYGATSYQWQVDPGSGWADLTGETSANLTVNGLSLSDNGNLYRLKAINSNGYIYSNGGTGVVLTVAEIAILSTDLTTVAIGDYVILTLNFPGADVQHIYMDDSLDLSGKQSMTIDSYTGNTVTMLVTDGSLTAGNVWLQVVNDQLVIADALHVHTGEEVGITADLIPSASTHLHTADNVTLTDIT